MQLLYLHPDQIELDPDGVRENSGEVSGLADTIREQGLLQPLGVLPLGRERYRVVYGGRRLRAAQDLGLGRVPCIVLEPEVDVLVQQLVENIQRLELNDLEKARSFARLRDRIRGSDTGQLPNEGQAEERISSLVGLAPRTIRRYLGLLDLEPEVQELLRTGELSVTQAQHLRRVTTPKTQIELAQLIVDEGLPAAEVSNLAAYFVANPNLGVDAAMQALANNLELRTEASVPVEAGGPLPKGGAPAADMQSDNDLWDDDGPVEDNGSPFGGSPFAEGEASRNKARVFRIRSLDQMVDEADRLARAYHEGDLQRWVSEDDGSSLKLRLLVKQLRSLTQALEALVSAVEIEH